MHCIIYGMIGIFEHSHFSRNIVLCRVKRDNIKRLFTLLEYQMQARTMWYFTTKELHVTGLLRFHSTAQTCHFPKLDYFSSTQWICSIALSCTNFCTEYALLFTYLHTPPVNYAAVNQWICKRIPKQTMCKCA